MRSELLCELELRMRKVSLQAFTMLTYCTAQAVSCLDHESIYEA